MVRVPYLQEMPIYGNLAQKRATLLKTPEKVSRATKTVTCIVLDFARNIGVGNG